MYNVLYRWTDEGWIVTVRLPISANHYVSRVFTFILFIIRSHHSLRISLFFLNSASKWNIISLFFSEQIFKGWYFVYFNSNFSPNYRPHEAQDMSIRLGFHVISTHSIHVAILFHHVGHNRHMERFALMILVLLWQDFPFLFHVTTIQYVHSI